MNTEILTEYFNGELSEAERARIEEWAQSDPANAKAFEDARNEYLAARWGVRSTLIRGDYSSISGRIGAPPARPRRLRFGAAAAAVAALVIVTGTVAGLGFLRNRPSIAEVGLPQNSAIIEWADSVMVLDGSHREIAQENGTVRSLSNGEVIFAGAETVVPDAMSKITIPRGARPMLIHLSDGSKVWLGPESRLEFTTLLGTDERRVTFSGEGYFDVAHEPERPFVVETQGQRITVLGTKFNVEAFEQHSTVYTTLVSGKVNVTAPGQGNAVILSPGQQSAVDRATGGIEVREVETAGIASWTEGVTSIEKMSLAVVLEKLSRRYDVDFDTSGYELDDIVLRGDLPSEESLEVVLSVLEKAGNVKFNMRRDGKISVATNE